MITMAFLQNLWVKNPIDVKALLDKHPNDEGYRRSLIKHLLFIPRFNSLTGKRIKLAYGGEVSTIIWEECTKEIADNSKNNMSSRQNTY